MRLWKTSLLVVVLVSLVGCIPSDNAETKEEALGGPAGIPEVGAADSSPDTQNVLPKASSNPGQAQIVAPLDTLGGSNVGVRISPMKEGAGFDVEGSLGLVATLIRPNPEVDEWVLDGHFSFPTSGFSVGESFASPLTDINITDKGAEMTASTEMVIITIPVRRPEVGAVLEKKSDKTPVHIKVPGGKSARFTIVLMSG